MRQLTLIFIGILFLSFFNRCKTIEEPIFEFQNSNSEKFDWQINLKATQGKAFNHPTFAIWQEDMAGNFIKTLFLTKSYASGTFGHELVGDSIWLSRSGKSIQPAALPYWTFKKGQISGDTKVPSPDSPYIDGFTGATPQSSFEFKTGLESEDTQFRILLEVNQTWDWNKYWTNNKYPESKAYKHSAQPSVIYAVTINSSEKEYFMNLIGHGDPRGETGKLFTDLSNFTSAKEIFEMIKISVKK